MIVINSDMFLNLRGHLGHSGFSATPFIRVLGKRQGRLVFDFSSSLLILKQALNYALHLKQYKSINHKFFLIVHDKNLALYFKHFFFSDSKYSKHTKIFFNWVSGSLTRGDSVVSLFCRKEIRQNKLTRLKKNKKAISLPALVVVLGPYSEMQPLVMEAFHLRIPTVAIVDSNFSGREVTFPVFGNDDSSSFFFFFR